MVACCCARAAVRGEMRDLGENGLVTPPLFWRWGCVRFALECHKLVSMAGGVCWYWRFLTLVTLPVRCSRLLGSGGTGGASSAICRASCSRRLNSPTMDSRLRTGMFISSRSPSASSMRADTSGLLCRRPLLLTLPRPPLPFPLLPLPDGCTVRGGSADQ